MESCNVIVFQERVKEVIFNGKLNASIIAGFYVVISCKILNVKNTVIPISLIFNIILRVKVGIQVLNEQVQVFSDTDFISFIENIIKEVNGTIIKNGRMNICKLNS